MKTLPRPWRTTLLAFVLVIFGGACGAKEEFHGPEPLEENEVVPTLESTFESGNEDAGSELDEDIRQVARDFNQGNYPRVILQVEKLMQRKDLSDEQKTVLAQINLTAHQKLREASASGNRDAEQFLKYKQETK